MIERKLINLDDPTKYHMVTDQLGPIEEQVAAIKAKWGTENVELGPVIDLEPICKKPMLDAEYKKAEAYLASKFDTNSLTSAADILSDLKERGLYTERLDLVQWIKHARRCARYPDGLWDVYYQNKAKILAGEDPEPYTVFDDVVPIAQMEIRFRQIVQEAGQEL